MAGPQNTVMGDQNFGTTLPETQVDEAEIKELEKRARFSKTAEFKTLKAHLEGRIAFYQQYLPNGEAVGGKETPEELGRMWIVANIIIGEFRAALASYELAAEEVKARNAKK